MGVAGLWEVLRPAAETRSMTELAVSEGFIANPQGLRGFRIGIDASIWFFHAEYGREGENPVLRTLFFRCATLMRTTFLPLFVFDGPKRPDFKRGKKIDKTSHKLIPGMKAIIEAFGFEWRTAPAEAEAELAYLNRVGIIDAVLSDDVDNFLFGATTVIRNISNKLSGNRANPILNNQGRDDKNHTRGGLILIGLLSGGDYAQAGLPGCGITTAHALARCGFGDSLYEAAITLPREALPGFLTVWRQGLREELKTNSRGIIGRKLVKLAKEVPTSFPDIDILLSYTSPVTSESLGRAAKKNLRPEWGREPDIGKLAALCEFYFEWGYKESIIKRFRTLLWHSVVLRILRRAVINAGASDHGSVMPSTSCKGKDSTESRIINTPSKMVAKHFSSMDLNSLASQSYGEVDSASEPLIIKIHSSRNHASTDGLLEYRLEVAPAQLVRLAESGIKGMREPPEKDEWASAEDAGGGDDNSAVRGNTKGPKPPPDPTSHMRLWMPACMLELAEPGVVEEYKRRKLNGEVKKNGKAPKYTSMPLKPLYDSEQDQCQTIDMLSERQRTMHSTPIRTAKDQEMKIQPIREESDESESDALIMPIFTRKAVSLGTRSTRSSKAAGPSKREKCSNSALDYLSLSDEENEIKHVNSWHATSTLKIESMPAPFLIPLDNDNDVFSPSDTQGQLTISAKTSYHRQMSDSERPKLPRKSLKHNSPRHLIEPHTHTISQSHQKPAPGVKKVVDLSIIEISSDDSDVTSSPVTCLRAKTHYSAINDGQGEVKR